MGQSELYLALKEISVLEYLSKHEIDRLVENGHYAEFDKGTYIYHEGQAITHVYILISGVVKITRESSEREVLKSIQHPKTILDDLSIAGQQQRTSNAIVMSPLAGTYQIDSNVIHDIIEKNPALAMSLLNYLGSRLQYTEERLESFVLNDARERIVEFLKVNAESFGQAIGYEMLLKHNFTQQDIANYTGTSRQTVTMVLNDLKKTNKIHFKRQSILIRDLKALA